jgi:hypothetical protein
MLFLRQVHSLKTKVSAPLLGTVIAFSLTGAASAQQRIGEAASVQNQVVRVSAGTTAGLSVGGSVFRNETIRTAAASSARLVFLDQTNLAVGPSSSVVLNQFVYSGGSAAQAVGVNLVRGAFRFTTGASDKNAYKINTPVATIGVRGTVLDINSQQGQTLVTMVDNSEALVCATNTRNCVTLNGSGDAVRVTSGGVQRMAPGTGYSFASNCSGDLCGGSSQPPGGDLLCGR